METLYQLNLTSEGCGSFGSPPLTSERSSASLRIQQPCGAVTVAGGRV